MDTQASTAPWLGREDWAAGWVESTTGGRGLVVAIWAFTLIWNVMSWWALIEAIRGNAGGDTWVAPLFPAAGLGLLALAVHVTRHQQRWGRSRLRLLTSPGVLGGPLRCVLHASPALAGAETLQVALHCIGAKPGRGAIRPIQHLWHHEERIPRARFELGDLTRVPLAFRLPYDLPEAHPRRQGEDAIWTLRAHATLPGVDYDATFELPVFRTAESSPSEEGSLPEVSALAPVPGAGVVWSAGADGRALPGSKIRMRPYGAGGVELVFGMLRNPWMGLFYGLFGLAFCLFLSFAVYAGEVFFGVAFGLATLLIAYASLDTLFGVTRVRAERGRIHVRHGPFGLGPSWEVGLHEIERIGAVPQMDMGSVTYCKIRIERRARHPGERAWRRRITAGTRIPSKTEAEALARALSEAVGL